MEKFVVPAVHEQRAFLDGTDGFFPLITPVQFAALDNAAAGKTQEARMQIRERLHHVRAQAAGTMFPGVVGEQRNEINVHRPRAVHEHIQFRLRVGVFRVQHGGIFFPVAGKIFQPHGVEQRAVAGIKFNAESRCAGDAADLRGEIVGFARLHAHAAKTLVGHAEKILALGLEAEVMRIGGVERIFVTDGNLAARLAGRQFAPAHQRIGKFEAAIFHQFGIQSAVRAEVDVLKKNAPHRGVDFCARLVGLDGDGRRGCGSSRHTRSGDESEQIGFHVLHRLFHCCRR